VGEARTEGTAMKIDLGAITGQKSQDTNQNLGTAERTKENKATPDPNSPGLHDADNYNHYDKDPKKMEQIYSQAKQDEEEGAASSSRLMQVYHHRAGAN
jgi:hypothetical protein